MDCLYPGRSFYLEDKKMREPQWKQLVVGTDKPLLDPEQCDELIRIGQSEPQYEGIILRKKGEVGPTIRKSTVSWIPFDKAKPIYQKIESWVSSINLNYFGYDNILVREKAQYAEYSEGGFYNWHMDHPADMSSMPLVRKISLGILLNDPKEFKGGEFEFFGEIAKKNFKTLPIRGSAVLFASFLMHRVKRVTEGNRKSLVMWFGGTPLK